MNNSEVLLKSQYSGEAQDTRTADVPSVGIMVLYHCLKISLLVPIFLNVNESLEAGQVTWFMEHIM